MNLIVARVPSGEVAYAAALFMAAAQHRLHNVSRSHPDQCLRCDQVYSDVVKFFLTDLAPDALAEREITCLHAVFRQFWDASVGLPQHEAVCSRVLAFHLFMVRTEGRPVQEWVSPSDDEEGEVFLHDAVVHAIGSVPIRREGGICPVEFASEVRIYTRLQ